jgi:hypothetical protein
MIVNPFEKNDERRDVSRIEFAMGYRKYTEMLILVFGQKANFALSLLQKKEEEEEDSKPDATFPSFAVIAIALIAMGEDIGVEMSL